MTGQHIINYLRASQSSDALRLALSEVAGLAILPADGLLMHAYDNGRQTVYKFDSFTLIAKYKHEALTVGTYYTEGTVIGGEYIRVYSQQEGSDAQWWRQLDWSDGLPMTGVFEGLIIPDALVRFYWVEDWVDSAGTTRKHIRADFDTDDTDLRDRFWAQVHSAEERTEKTLADTDDLSTVANGTDVNLNMLDFYFRYLLRDRGVVVDLQTNDLGDKVDRAVNSFLRREMPVGSVLIRRVDGQEAYA